MRLVVDEDDNGKLRPERVNPYSAGIDFSRQSLTSVDLKPPVLEACGDVRQNICRRQILTTCGHQILTTKVDPRTVGVEIFLMGVDP